MGEQDSDKKLPAGGAEEVKLRKKSKKDKVEVEKIAAEGLPPGWIKEVKLTKKFGKVRQDKFYVDPASGYVFRSMKDALRYVETGVVGKLAFKPKDTDETDEDMHDDESPTEAKKQKVAVHGAKGSEEIGEKDPEDGVSASPTAGGGSLNEKSPEDEKTRSAKMNRPTPVKSKVKKTPDLPRRASKRLAGIALDPTPGLKTKARANQAAAKQPDNVVATAAEESSPDGNADKARKGKSSSSATRNEHSGKVETESKAESNDDLVNQEPGPGPALDLPLADLWSDPCIAFAIKTLTGIADDAPKVSSESNSSIYPMTTSEEHTRNILPSEPAGKPENSNDMPCADIFADPCIEFAIKTLTGVVPIEYDLQISSSLQAQSSGHSTFSDVGSGNYPRTSLFSQQFNVTEPAFSFARTTSLQGSGGTSLFSQQFNVTEPAFSFARTTSLQSSGGTVLHRRGNGRR